MLTIFQMERNEDCSLAQAGFASVHRPVLLLCRHSVLCLDHDVRVLPRSASSGHGALVPALVEEVLTPYVFREYLPTLVPVEVAEPKARLWFKSLLSGVEYLHKRGIVHNDIKLVTSFRWTS